MSRLAEQYKKKDLTVLAVNVRPGETADMVREFAREHDLKLTFLQDGMGVAMDYEVRGVPATFFLDVTGAVDSHLVGYSPARLDQAVEAILPRT